MPKSREQEPQKREAPRLKKATWAGEFVRNSVGKIVHKANLSIEGEENLEALRGSGAIIVVAPHNGHLDTLLVRNAISTAFRKQLFFLAAADYWDKAVSDKDDAPTNKIKQNILVSFRRIFSPAAVRILPIDRFSTEQAYSDLEQAAERALAGEMPVIYPEGTRSRDGKKPISEREFKTGLGLLVLMTEGKVPIVPVYLEGNENLMPPDSNSIQFADADGIPHRVVVHIGEPIDTSSLVHEPIESMSRQEQRTFRRMITSLVHGHFVGTYEDINGELEDTRPY
ncbi:MAG: 1-acyl-sn-glycerol-3-phosphate acyltransferase [Pseudomonadales bacterium]|nr:1-acyl-sn-glycerol-3-phosphate acyltransferase [Pseudomonadales bacterium]